MFEDLVGGAQAARHLNAIFGWFGTFLYLLNHALLLGRKSHPMALYLILNIIAAASVMFASCLTASWQSVGINLFWIVVSSRRLFLPDMHISILSEMVLVQVVVGIVGLGILALVDTVTLSAEVWGWASFILYCGCYVLFTGDKIPRYRYAIYDAFASALIIPSLFFDMNWPVVALQTFWCCISIWGARKAHRDMQLIG